MLTILITAIFTQLIVRRIEAFFTHWKEFVIGIFIRMLLFGKYLFSRAYDTLKVRGNRLFYGYLIVVVHVLLFKVAYGEEMSIQMPYNCPSKIPSEWMNPSACYRSCNMDGLTSQVQNLTIYQHDVKESMNILECKKWKSTVTATETWTFSKLPYKEENKPEDTNPTECWSKLKELCNNKECETSKPQYSVDYSYAADVVKEYVWFQLKYRSAPIPFSYDEESYIRLEGKNIDYTAEQAYSLNDEKKLILWKVNTSLQCYPQAVSTLQCNQLFSSTNSVSHYICGGGRFVITAGSQLNTRHCTYNVPTYISDEGIIYSRSSGSDLVKDGLPIFKDSLNSALKEIVLQQRVQSIMASEQTCKHSCLVPYPKENGTIFYYGNRRVAKLDDKEFLLCKEDLSCSLIKPLQFCAGDNLLAVRCSGARLWWDPSTLYVDHYTTCRSTPSGVPSIKFAAHGAMYTANTSGVFYLGGTEIKKQIDGPSIGQDLVLLGREEIINALRSSPDLTGQTGSVLNQNVKRAGWNFGIIDFLEKLEHEVKVWAMLMVLTVCGVIVVYLFIPTTYLRKGQYRKVQYQMREF
ncbi:glycoprotein [Soybean blotchy mosaic virus]|nr:glycoprotein [Soybean blotchy mosaic virus]